MMPTATGIKGYERKTAARYHARPRMGVSTSSAMPSASAMATGALAMKTTVFRRLVQNTSSWSSSSS